jgi:5'-AMP-activated protein kinase, catalytic alpha subunit
VRKALQSGDPHNEFAIAYHLIIDNKQMSEAHNRVQIDDFFLASSPPSGSFFMDMASTSIDSNIMKDHPERMPQLKDVTPTLDLIINKQIDPSDTSKVPSELTTGAAVAAAAAQLEQRKQKKAKWHLGIRSQSKPQDIMNEVFKAMKSNKIQWKYYNSSIYNLRVRKPIYNGNEKRYIKIGLQLYQVDQKSYLLDFRSFDLLPDEEKAIMSVEHHNMMEFFELCSDLIGALAR